MPPPTTALLRIDDLYKSFDEGDRRRQVLRGASAEIAQGEITAILGESGSGKSTLLNLIGGIDRADSGSVSIAGIDLTALDEDRRTLFRRNNLGIVFQFFNLIDTLTVFENVALPLELRGDSSDTIQTAVSQLLERVGLGDRGDSFPDRLSGGEQQRVAIARALIHQPKLVLADEPTGNLDAKTGTSILELLGELSRQHDTTLVLVTHSRTAAAIADRVLTMRDGLLEPT